MEFVPSPTWRTIARRRTSTRTLTLGLSRSRAAFRGSFHLGEAGLRKHPAEHCPFWPLILFPHDEWVNAFLHNFFLKWDLHARVKLWLTLVHSDFYLGFTQCLNGLAFRTLWSWQTRIYLRRGRPVFSPKWATVGTRWPQWRRWGCAQAVCAARARRHAPLAVYLLMFHLTHIFTLHLHLARLLWNFLQCRWILSVSYW